MFRFVLDYAIFIELISSAEIQYSQQSRLVEGGRAGW